MVTPQKKYKQKIKRSFFEIIGDTMEMNAYVGADIGEDLLGIPGQVVGFVLGGACGAVEGFFDAVFHTGF